MIRSIFISTCVATILLFVWGALAQMLPWGVPTVQIISTMSEEADGPDLPSKTIRMSEASLVTEEFDEQMSGKISTLITDHTFSWVISRPLKKYNLTVYLVRELLTQFVVALFLSVILQLSNSMNSGRRILLILFAALATVTATHIQDLNWLGTTTIFSIGNAFNLVVGWLLASAVVCKWIIRARGES